MSTDWLATVSPIQVVGGSVLGWVILRLVQRLVRQNPLSKLPGPPSKSWLTGTFPARLFHTLETRSVTVLGHFLDLLSPDGWDFHVELARKYGGISKLEGLFRAPLIYVFDPKALHHVLVKDSDVYEENIVFLRSNEVGFGKGLLATAGDLHRRQRKMLNPVFSMGHMRRMVPTFYEVVFKLRTTLENKLKNGPQEIDILHWMTRTALELVGQSGLGYSFDPLAEDGEEHPYSIAVKSYTTAISKLNFPQFTVLPIAARWGTVRLRRFVVDVLSLVWSDLRMARDIVDVMTETSITIYEEKKKALEAGDDAVSQQIGKGNDIISILMRANMEASEEDRLPKDEVLAQMSTMTFAAMDTTSNALSRILLLLSENPDAQERVRSEIKDAIEEHGQTELSYDVLMGLPYLDAVIRETLRLHPPISLLMRDVTRDAVLPFSKPIVGADGEEMTEVVVPKGTTVLMSILSANRNIELWGPDADEWKPDRWLSPLPEGLVRAKVPGIYSHLLTFLGGGRACIGFKFSELEMKVVLSVLLDRMRFTSLKKKISWRMNVIAQPVVDEPGYDREEAQLPMQVELLSS